MIKATIGRLVYFDSFSGLIPCKLIAVAPCGSGEVYLSAKITAPRGPWRRGEVFHAPIGHGRIVPREAVYRSRQACGQYRIRSFQWEV